MGLLGAGSSALAQEEPLAFDLGSIQVSTAASTTSTSETATVGSQTMRQFDRNTVGTALDMLPGVDIGKVGARNEQVAFVRGFDLRQVPVFVDGIPVYVPYDGYVDLARFTTLDLARIDVAKGFSSTLFGANTLGGAINLVTRRPRKAFEADLGLGQTMSNEQKVNSTYGYANLGSKQDKWYVQLGLSYLDQPYYRLPDSFTPTKGDDGGKRNNSQQRDDKVNLKLAYTPNATDEYALNLISQHGTKGTPPYAGSVSGVTVRYWQWPYWDKDSAYFLSNTVVGSGHLKLRAYHDTFKNSLYTYDDATYSTQVKGSSFKSWYDDFTNGFSVQGDAPLSSANTLKAAYHWKTDVHREHNAGEPIRHFKDLTQSLGLEDLHEFDARWRLVSGLSYATRQSLEAEDYNSSTKVVSDFTRHDNHGLDAQAGLFYALDPQQELKATVARKSRFPTIKDRYSYRLGTALPNAALKVEEATHLEVGYAATLLPGWRGEANLFHSDIDDLIQSVTIAPSACSTPPCSQMQNIGKGRNDGVELSLDGSAGNWRFGGNYTYLQRKNVSSPNLKPTDTPRHKVFVHTDYQWASWTFTASADAMSRRYSTSDGKQVAAGFGVVDLKAAWLWRSDLTVEGGVRNAADKLYAYTEGFPEAGRTWFLQLRARF